MSCLGLTTSSTCPAPAPGVFIAPSKMTLDELRVESEVNGMSTDGLTRAQMVRQVKARRDSLPEDVKVIQVRGRRLRRGWFPRVIAGVLYVPCTGHTSSCADCFLKPAACHP